MKKLLLALTITIAPSLQPMNLSPMDSQSVTLSFDSCAQCKKKATVKCISCLGVTYCSVECQNLHQNACHRLECPIIAFVHRGNIELARNFFISCCMAAIKENSKDLAVKALLWHQKAMVRAFQDRSLLKNPAICTALKTIEKKHRPLVQQLIKNGIISSNYNLYELNRFALDWAEDITNNNSIVGPEGILPYIPSEIRKNTDLFINEKEWKARRRSAIIDIIMILRKD